MDTYSTLRHFADSWALLAMTVFYIGAMLWAFRPGSRKSHTEAAELPFRNDTLPPPGCDGACADCPKSPAFLIEGKA